jgi:hypothetical protein
MFESENNEELLDYIKSSEIFEESKNIQELIDNNVSYLKGDLSSTCYTLGPIETQTYGILDQLIQINNLGFISVKSCNGMKDPTGCYNKSHTNKKRSFLRGLIKKSDYVKLQALDSKDFIVNIHHQKNSHLHYSNILNDDLWIHVCNCEHLYIKNIEQSSRDSFECFVNCKHIYSKLLEDYCDVSILDIKFSRPYFLFDKIIKILK